MARFLLLILAGLEATSGFRTASAYLRTYHNVTADDLTRKGQAEIDELIQRFGLQRMAARPAWGDFADRGWARRAFP